MHLSHAQLCNTFRPGDRTFGTGTPPGVLQYWETRQVHCSYCVGSSISLGCLGTLLPVFFTTHLGTRLRFDTVWVVLNSIRSLASTSSSLAYVSVSIFEQGSRHFESPMSSKSWVFFLMSTAEFVTRLMQRLGPSG